MWKISVAFFIASSGILANHSSDVSPDNSAPRRPVLAKYENLLFCQLAVALPNGELVKGIGEIKNYDKVIPLNLGVDVYRPDVLKTLAGDKLNVNSHFSLDGNKKLKMNIELTQTGVGKDKLKRVATVDNRELEQIIEGKKLLKVSLPGRGIKELSYTCEGMAPTQARKRLFGNLLENERKIRQDIRSPRAYDDVIWEMKRFVDGIENPQEKKTYRDRFRSVISDNLKMPDGESLLDRSYGEILLTEDGKLLSSYLSLNQAERMRKNFLTNPELRNKGYFQWIKEEADGAGEKLLAFKSNHSGLIQERLKRVQDWIKSVNERDLAEERPLEPPKNR